MTIREIVVQGIHYTRTCKSLWLFGFVVGSASGGSNGAGNEGGASAAGAAGAAATGLQNLPWAVIAVLATVLLVAFVILRFVSEGALIEGVVRSRQGGVMTTREGFRAGWAHWGVLLRIGLAYLGATLGSVLVLALPCLVLAKTFGVVGGVLAAVPALIVAVPWLVTLYLVQAFASRIAVLEDRHALDAIAKARLFLHGRLGHGLKLIVASFVGSIAIGVVSVVLFVPVALLLMAFMPLFGLVPVIVMAGLVFVPLTCVLTAILGTFRSSVWTIGYVTEAAA
jgi:hypothetical protein